MSGNKMCFWLLYLSLRLAAQDTGQPVNINTEKFNEYAPSLSADGKTMIFQSNRRGGRYELFSTQLEEGKWTAPAPIEAINTHGAATDLLGGPSISYDGNVLYFCANFSGGYGDLDIYYSERKKDGWGKPENLGKTINTSGYEGFPCISADGKKLYFTRFIKKNPQGENCFEVFVSHKDSKGRWQEPVKLPVPINTGCEKAPRIMADNSTLYFSSLREGSKGSFDLYRTELKDDGDWTEPLALDFVNSPESDQFASVSASGITLFYVTKGDIYTITIPPKYRQNLCATVQGYITDRLTGAPLAATVQVRDAGTTELLAEIKSDANDGRYTAILLAGKKYELNYVLPGYSYASATFDLEKQKEYKEFKNDVSLFSKVKLSINVNDLELYFNPEAEVSVVDAATGQAMDAAIRSVARGRYVAELPLGRSYRITSQSKGYSAYQFSLNLTGNIAYRELEKDMDMVPLKKEVQINITDAASGAGLEVDILITNPQLNEQIYAKAITGKDGKHAVHLREGNSYKVEVKSPKGYAYYNESITVAKNKDHQLKIPLVPLVPGSMLLLKDILFETNSYELHPSSYHEINRVIQLMNDNPGLVIEIAGHTDDVGSEAFNLNLSQKRAAFVTDYMISRDIDRLRLQPKGYGEGRPAVPNTSEENKEKNRRLELIVLRAGD